MVDWELIVQTMNSVVNHQTDRPGGLRQERTPENHFPFRTHPLTCGNDSRHTPLYPYFNGERVVLVCRDCGYTQDNCAGHEGGRSIFKAQNAPKPESIETAK